MTITSTESILNSNQHQDIVLSVKNVSKRFCRDFKRSLFYGVQDIIGEVLGLQQNKMELRPNEFWALKDINLELHRGEALGLVGANGAGKTTLLKVISGLIRPDEGEVEVRGKVAPLIALGAGFNPMLTGRENIYVNMSILGLSDEEIKDRLDDVIAFAEIGEAVDSPVQGYSSGMAARLGFSCAIHVEPDILILDEVLAVGDVKFRAKCYRRLGELREKNVSFILVSHQPQSILQVCDSALYLAKGKYIMSGSPLAVTDRYEQDLFSTPNNDNGNRKEGTIVFTKTPKSSEESLGLDILKVFFKKNNQVSEKLYSGEPVSFCIHCRAHRVIKDFNVYLKISSIDNAVQQSLFLGTTIDDIRTDLLIGDHEIDFEMPYLGLPPGLYSMDIKLKSEKLYTLDFLDSYRFKVQPDPKMNMCTFYQPRNWSIKEL